MSDDDFSIPTSSTQCRPARAEFQLAHFLAPSGKTDDKVSLVLDLNRIDRQCGTLEPNYHLVLDESTCHQMLTEIYHHLEKNPDVSERYLVSRLKTTVDALCVKMGI